MPVIYLDILLALNWLVDFLLLAATRRVLRIPAPRWRLLAGAACGAASCCIILWDIPAAALLLFKMAAAAVVVRTAFRYNGPRPFCKQLVVFAILSAVFAGVTMGVWMLAPPPGFYVIGGAVYFDISPVVLAGLAVLSYGVISLFDRAVKKREPLGRDYRLRVSSGGRTAVWRVLYDSGNSLVEPFSGVPAAVVEAAAASELWPEWEQLWNGDEISAAGVRLIPYQSVGSRGLLPAFKPDKAVLLTLTEERDVSGCYIAVCPTLGRGGYQGLVGLDLINS